MGLTEAISRRSFLEGVTGVIGATAVSPKSVFAQASFASKRPAPSVRRFRSKAVDAAIASTAGKMRDPELAWLFSNCLPNTLDTTVQFTDGPSAPDTIVITGDIPAMWLRDSSAQVWPYLQFINHDAAL